MSERYKLGLTRNRLFEFDNCVLFCGKIDGGFNAKELRGALKLLALKEPIITSAVQLENDGTAFLVTESFEPDLKERSESFEDVFASYERDGLNFWEQLFEFSLSADGYIVIAGHTAVCDAKSLLRLAMYLYTFYTKSSVNIEPSVINLFEKSVNLPIEVASPVLDKLGAELDAKWMKNAENYGVNDYIKAKNIYSQTKCGRAELRAELDKATVSALCEYAVANNVDVSSVVAFAFYETLVKYIGGSKKYNKMNIYADERFFFDDFHNYSVGAFNGVVNASLTGKERHKPTDERVKAFNCDCYKGATSSFKVFYDEALLMKIEPSLCDSAYMYEAGLTKSAASRKVAENYGCACEKICDFFACNTDQAFWDVLKNFSRIHVSEPLKMRSSTYVGFLRGNGVGYITFKYKTDRISDSKAKDVLNDAILLIENITGTKKKP